MTTANKDQEGKVVNLQISTLNKDVADLKSRVGVMESNTTSFLHSLDKNILLLTENLKQVQSMSAKQDKRMLELSEQMSDRDKIMVDISNSLTRSNEKIEDTANKVSTIESKFYESESKSKLDVREVKMNSYKNIATKIITNAIYVVGGYLFLDKIIK